MSIQVTKEEVAELYPMRCISGFSRGPFIDTGLDIEPFDATGKRKRVYLSEALIRQAMHSLKFPSPEDYAEAETRLYELEVKVLSLEADLAEAHMAEKFVPLSEVKAELERIEEAGRAEAVQELVREAQEMQRETQPPLEGSEAIGPPGNAKAKKAKNPKSRWNL